jgi:methionyl-tRNA synthetase
MAKKTYFTTPLYYVNDKPHIGHAYTNILVDTLTRLHRFLGEEVHFLTGTDEHGEKISKTAATKGMSEKDFVESIVPRFTHLWEVLGIEYDQFIRTTDENHKAIVKQIVQKLYEKGDIYKSKYTGWYSIKSETFYKESELVDGRCPDTGGEIQRIEEENYFFKMSKYQDWLINKIKTEDGFIRPETRRREVLGFLDNPLEDLCISRPKTRMSWGIELPFDTDFVIYVWFDALVNYISAASYIQDEKRFKSLWPADAHIVGKDILRHHAVYWSIMLEALGLECPKTIYAHGWWIMGGEKMSKSTGNIVDPILLSEKYGTDAIRYYVLREVQLGLDGAFSEGLLAERFRTDLANDLGNLVHRTFSMSERYFDGVVQEPQKDYDYLLKGPAEEMIASFKGKVQEFNMRGILEDLWKVIVAANRAVEERQPWKLAKDPEQKEYLGSFLYELLETCRLVGIYLSPFMPQTGKKLLDLYEIKGIPSQKDFQTFGTLKPGQKLTKGEPLFPKLEESNA